MVGPRTTQRLMCQINYETYSKMSRAKPLKRVQRFTHGTTQRISKILSEAMMINSKIKKTIKKFTTSCIQCASCGRKVNTIKDS